MKKVRFAALLMGSLLCAFGTWRSLTEERAALSEFDITNPLIFLAATLLFIFVERTK